jgi:hypothetical protein
MGQTSKKQKDKSKNKYSSFTFLLLTFNFKERILQKFLPYTDLKKECDK